MRSTGIVRRIDELGRVVIPKEIRRTMKIREGEELEVFTTENNSLILKKYSAVNELERLATEYTEAVSKSTGYTAVITDADKVVAVSGDIRIFKQGDSLSYKGEKLIQERKPRLLNGKNVIAVIGEDTANIGGIALHPIIKAGDVMGAVILFSSKELNDLALMLAQTAASFFAAQA
ncbi:MAG: stage V sporulation T C-terminal domain-containing protein [Clostridia bacterium]